MKKKRMPGRQKHTLLIFCGIHQFLLLFRPNAMLFQEARNRLAPSRSLWVGTKLELLLPCEGNAAELPMFSCHASIFPSISSCDLSWFILPWQEVEKQACIKFFKNQIIHNTVPEIVQFSSVAQSCPTLCDPMNHSMPGLPVHHQLPEFTQTHVHRVGNAIQPSHPLLSPSPPAPNPLWQKVKRN